MLGDRDGVGEGFAGGGGGGAKNNGWLDDRVCVCDMCLYVCM